MWSRDASCNSLLTEFRSLIVVIPYPPSVWRQRQRDRNGNLNAVLLFMIAAVPKHGFVDRWRFAWLIEVSDNNVCIVKLWVKMTSLDVLVRKILRTILVTFSAGNYWKNYAAWRYHLWHTVDWQQNEWSLPFGMEFK